MRSYYLYRHIDIINNIPFYIGIGTNKRYFYYARSKVTTKRSNEWKEYVKKIDYQYRIEIMFETEDFLLINRKEREFIKLYGRRDLGRGNLVNKDNGGRGKKEFSNKSLNNMIKKQKCKSVVVYNHKGEKLGVFNRSMEAADFSGTSYFSVKQCLMKKHEQSKGFRFRYLSENEESLPPIEYRYMKAGTHIVCENIKTGETIRFETMRKASRAMNIPEGTIGNNLNGTTKFARRTYKFRYIEDYLKERQIL